MTSMNGTGGSGLGEEGEAMRVGTKVATVVVLSFICLLTAVGNILVITSIVIVRRLRTPPNTLILSLAISDLNVAILVMPVAIVYQVEEYWVFNSQLLCDAWISTDVISCTASIIHLCMISIDRYLAISRPFSYEKTRTYRFMLLLVAIAWTIAIMVPLPPLIFFGNESIHLNRQCLISQNKIYTIYSTFSAFYMPLFVMCFVYVQLYRSAASISKMTNEQCNPSSFALKSTTGGGGGGAEDSPTSTTGGRGRRKQAKLNFNTETKAARTLGIIMGAFCVCWVPFFLLTLLRPFVYPYEPPPIVVSLLLWLGYSNSFLNPIIYAAFNREFRTPYWYIITCRMKDINRRCNLALNPFFHSDELNSRRPSITATARRNSVGSVFSKRKSVERSVLEKSGSFRASKKISNKSTENGEVALQTLLPESKICV